MMIRYGSSHRLGNGAVSAIVVDGLLGYIGLGASADDAVATIVVDGLLGCVLDGAGRESDLSEGVH